MQESLFHLSEDRHINLFNPLPASFYPGVIMRDVVFAVNDKMQHNYLLPRNCPRVSFYDGPQTTDSDRHQFLENSTARFVVCVESSWINEIQRTTLFRYEFPSDSFTLLDECAGYFISHVPVTPIRVTPIYNLMEEMLRRDVELRFMPSIIELGEEVTRSTLNYSLIRMKYAKTNPGSHQEVEKRRKF